jgi:hypothetical protein
LKHAQEKRWLMNKNLDIISGKWAGALKIGMTVDEMIKYLGEKFYIEEIGDFKIYNTERFRIWVKNKRVTSFMIRGKFI